MMTTAAFRSQNRAERYVDFEQMEYMPEIASALDIYADEMTTSNEYDKLLNASDKDVYAASKYTTLPIAKSIVEKYVGEEKKIPWFIDLLNINLNNVDLKIAEKRIALYLKLLNDKGERMTENLDFIV